MHIEVRGSGRPLVMLHGWAMHGGVFAPLVDRLQSRFELHLVDLPGHGRSRESAVPLELAAIAAEVAARTPTAAWLGWSLGGLVALHAAQSRSGSVQSLVMLCASPRFVRAPGWPYGMDASVFHGFAADLQRDYAATIDRFLLLEAQGSDHLREDIRLLRQQVFAFGQPRPASLLDGLARLQDSDLRAGLASLPMPSLWIAGRRDRLVSPASMEQAAQLSGGRFLRIEHGGHAAFLTHADEVADAIADALALVMAATAP